MWKGRIGGVKVTRRRIYWARFHSAWGTSVGKIVGSLMAAFDVVKSFSFIYLSRTLTSTHTQESSPAHGCSITMGIDGNDLCAAALNALNLSEEDRKLIAFDGQNRLDVLSDLAQLVTSAKDYSTEERWQLHRPGGDGQTAILRGLFSKIIV